jgi:hypothetical protein
MKSQHNVIWLIIGICNISALGWLVNFMDPNYLVSLIMFFIFLFLTVFSITMFITNIVRRSLIVGSGVFVFFLLRFIGLREPLYIILLALSLISLELYFQKR